VLVVDDHLDSLDLYELGLAEYGFDTCRACDADEAFEVCSQRQPRAIVTDLAMPGTDGFGLIQRLKGDPATRDIPVLAVSGHASAQTRAEVMASGARAFLPKPCSVQDLEVALRDILFREAAETGPEADSP
jgi:CheY-like chemotaxis protein